MLTQRTSIWTNVTGLWLISNFAWNSPETYRNTRSINKHRFTKKGCISAERTQKKIELQFQQFQNTFTRLLNLGKRKWVFTLGERKKFSSSLQKWTCPHFFLLYQMSNMPWAKKVGGKKLCGLKIYAELINFPFISSSPLSSSSSSSATS